MDRFSIRDHFLALQKLQRYTPNYDDKMCSFLELVKICLNRTKVLEENLVIQDVEPQHEDLIVGLDVESFFGTMTEICQYLIKWCREDMKVMEPLVLEVLLDTLIIFSQDNTLRKALVSQDVFFMLREILESSDRGVAKCYKLLGFVCNDDDEAQKKLQESDLLKFFLTKFTQHFNKKQDPFVPARESVAALHTIGLMSQKSGLLSVELIRYGVPAELLTYILNNYNNTSDILFVSCVDLLGKLVQQGENAGDLLFNQEGECIDESLLTVFYTVITRSKIPDHWRAVLNFLEVCLTKYEPFANKCAEKGFFTDLFRFVAPKDHKAEPDEKSKKILDVLVFMTIPVKCCRFLAKTTSLLSDLISLMGSTTETYRASFALILGNFCYDDNTAEAFVSHWKFHQAVIEAVQGLLDSGPPPEEERLRQSQYFVSYLSILKNLVVPVVNRTTVSSHPKFHEIVTGLIVSQDQNVLQKLFILLRIIILKDDGVYPRALASDATVMPALITAATKPDSYILCRQTALLLLTVLLVEGHVQNSRTVVTKDFVRELANNAGPVFLSTLFGYERAHERLFSHFDDSDVKQLYEQGYFQSLFTFVVAGRHCKPIFIVNSLAAFKRLALIDDVAIRAQLLKWINDDFMASLSALEDFSQFISLEDLKQNIKFFNDLRVSYSQSL